MRLSNFMDWARESFETAARAVSGKSLMLDNVDGVRNIGEMMQAITGNRRWNSSYNILSGPYAAAVFPKDDPSTFATVYALSGLPNARCTQEEFNIFDVHSGRSYITAENGEGRSIEMVAWLTPLTVRFANEPEAVSHLKDLAIYDKIEIRLVSDGKMTLLRENLGLLQARYLEGYKMAAEGKTAILREAIETDSEEARTQAANRVAQAVLARTPD